MHLRRVSSSYGNYLSSLPKMYAAI
ncbi:unnamed protein product [Aureobasidium pullulans]|nr:unnamed protein product [Aureobasidium pullulans]